MTRNIVLFNGPPRSGKDTGAEVLRTRLGFHVVRFSEPLKRAVPALFNLNRTWLEANKDKPLPELLGKTPREVYISMSEDWLKKLYGESFFGRMIAMDIERAPHIRDWAVSDSGFNIESDTLQRIYPDSRLLVIKLKRPGCNFAEDSRGYITPPPGALTAHITNDDRMYYMDTVRSVVQQWLQFNVQRTENNDENTTEVPVDRT